MSGILEGTLSKWTNVMKGWQYRFFVLEETAGLLSYYTSKEKMMKGVRRGCVRLKGAVIGIDDQEDNTFTITVDSKTFHFQARDNDEREKWVRRLEDTIRRHAKGVRMWDSFSSSYLSSAYAQQNQTKKGNHLELLDKKISEADAYLQLMIEQTNKLSSEIDKLNAEEQQKCVNLQDNANKMLDHIKHSIVTLQIAKNMAHPINGVYQGPTKSSAPTNSLPTSSTNPTELASELDEKSVVLFVPEISYSSSEGEEDFYDANDELTPNTNASRAFSIETNSNAPNDEVSAQTSSLDDFQDVSECKSAELSRAPSTDKPEITSRKPGQLPLRKDGSIDYDALYEEEEEDDLLMESHGSMITHLLSQVKIGMDLTKVALPTFILERRSLLEMYADYFAHPDLFLKIADLDDPRDRIVQVCRWYMSAYHAGRKSSVAKKPYNPILGEVFQCHWNLPGEIPNEEEVTDGPVPWCKSNQLTFLAEQVSHHPPISAFYAEHSKKKISFAAYVWTKSKFLGLSIGVHNIGQGVITLCDRNEEYTVTFPNGYGRSILTIPWIELGGSVTINCPQTGYHADVEFLTKPFYGGKRHKITAEVYAPNEKKSFVSISGEWNGLMEAKWNESKRTEVFVDVNSIPIFKKQVRPIADQDEYESRTVWKEVTVGLKSNDIEKATSAKFQVEQKQREKVLERKNSNTQWNTKYFKPVGESWIYTKPLSQRLYQQEKENKR
ncbi:OSBPL9 family protein [Megaselia abdita]